MRDEDWDQLRDTISKVPVGEYAWLSVSTFFFGIAISFFIGATQINNVEVWIETGFWMATAGGGVGGLVCLIAFSVHRKHRGDGISDILSYMDRMKGEDTSEN